MRTALELQERKKQIDALRKRMETELNQWVDENEILDKGETLYFTLELVSRHSQASPKVKHVKKGREVRVSELRELTDEDWKSILSLNWEDRQKNILLTLQKCGNKSIKLKFFGELDRERINRCFRTNGFAYRIRPDDSKKVCWYWNKYHFICVMPPKGGS